MQTVGIYRIGYVDLDVSRTCRSLNRCQTYFRFIEGGTITTMGDPDLFDFGYSDRRFAQLLSPHSRQHDIMTAVTSAPIEDNFFTRTLSDPKAIIITAFQSEELLASSGRSAEERLALALCAELASFEFQRVTGQHWSALFHQDPRGCLFDFAGVKSQAIGKLRTFDMCQPCKGRLAESNMDQGLVRAVGRILDQIRKPSIRKAIIASVTSPRLAFVYGGIVIGSAVNVLSGLILGDGVIGSTGQLQLAAIVLFGVLVFPMGVYGWHWVSYVRLHLR